MAEIPLQPSSEQTDGWHAHPRPDVLDPKHRLASAYPGLDPDAMQGPVPTGHYADMADKIHGTTPIEPIQPVDRSPLPRFSPPTAK